MVISTQPQRVIRAATATMIIPIGDRPTIYPAYLGVQVSCERLLAQYERAAEGPLDQDFATLGRSVGHRRCVGSMHEGVVAADVEALRLGDLALGYEPELGVGEGVQRH